MSSIRYPIDSPVREQVELARIRVQALTNLGKTPAPDLLRLAKTDLGDGISFEPRRVRGQRRLRFS